MNGSILVHGGAGRFSSAADESKAATDGCLAAARAGYEVLRAGGSALDAVVAAVVILEDNPVFNAGTGSALNARGEVEMDAAVMDGNRGAAGAVAVLHTVKNPVLLARRVMERTSHVLLAGEGAETFARAEGVPTVPPASLITPAARRAWESAAVSSKHGTGGAVAFDGAHVAAATSTGGTAMKMPGRIGDSPLIGCGTYAQDGAGAASCTGLGEAIIRAVLARTAVDLLARCASPTLAAQEALPLIARFGGEGGLILVDAQGRLGLAFDTERMAHALVDGQGREAAGFAARGERRLK
jgi:beta-aspartyl-peptidase (threonine type)